MSGSIEAQTIPVHLTLAEWNVVFAGLGELPLKIAHPVAAKLQQQVAAAASQQQRINGELHPHVEDTP